MVAASHGNNRPAPGDVGHTGRGLEFSRSMSWVAADVRSPSARRSRWKFEDAATGCEAVGDVSEVRRSGP
jgi:hypothetical protein